MHYRPVDARINSSTNCSRSCKNCENRLVVFELKWVSSENENCAATLPKLYDIRSFGIGRSETDWNITF